MRKHGTTIDTRLTVIDKLPADDPKHVSGLAGDGARCRHAARLGERTCSAAPADRRRGRAFAVSPRAT